MSTLDLRDVTAALEAKGMKPDNNHHKMYSKQVDGLTTLKTRVSWGMRQIGDDLIARMAKQCALYKGEFVNLVECTLSAEQWDQIVRERCADGRNPFIPNR